MSQLNYNILAIARCTSQFRSEKMAEYGLKAFHISYLLNISNYPGISQDKLAQLIYINKSNVARQSAYLEEQGYIIRQPSTTDKRAMELYPTEKTLELVPKIRAFSQEWDSFLTNDLTPEEIQTVNQVLSKMRDKAAGWMSDR